MSGDCPTIFLLQRYKSGFVNRPTAASILSAPVMVLTELARAQEALHR